MMSYLVLSIPAVALPPVSIRSSHCSRSHYPHRYPGTSSTFQLITVDKPSTTPEGNAGSHTLKEAALAILTPHHQFVSSTEYSIFAISLQTCYYFSCSWPLPLPPHSSSFYSSKKVVYTCCNPVSPFWNLFPTCFCSSSLLPALLLLSWMILFIVVNSTAQFSSLLLLKPISSFFHLASWTSHFFDFPLTLLFTPFQSSLAISLPLSDLVPFNGEPKSLGDLFFLICTHSFGNII